MTSDIKQLSLCYIGGGSLGWAWILMRDLSLEREIGGIVTLYDIDYEAAKKNAVIGNRLMESDNPGQWKFVAVKSLKEALLGADFIFVSILPGDFHQMAVDVHTPEKYGIWQSVGDTVGPGGLMRALRTVPMYEIIARSIREYASEAWVFNYTNPMTICTKTLYKVFPEIKAFGCCHEVFGTQKLLVRALEDAKMVPPGSVMREEIRTSVMGINHFTWLDKASWKNHDLMPVYADFVKKYQHSGIDESADENWLNRSFKSRERVKMDLFARFGLIAAAGDRHLAEFCPPQWYIDSPEMVDSWDYSLTTVSTRISMREELRAKSVIYESGEKNLVSEQSGEEGIPQMKALLGLGNLITNVNLPNKGQMPDLPLGAVVETNAVFSRDSIQAVITNGLPTEIRSLTLQHLTNQEGIVEAALDRDLEKAYKVFCNDIHVQKISLKESKLLFDEMTSKTLKDSEGWNL